VERGRKGKKKEGGRHSSELLSHGRFDIGGFREERGFREDT